MTGRLLVVEDDPALLFMLEAALLYGGFQTHSVRNGLAALEAAKSESFDGILMDLGLPDLDGGELLRRLRDMSDLPIIVVSGRGGEQDKIDALDLGADDFIAKPFLPGELLARIRAALRRSAPLDRDEALALVRDVRLSSPTLTRGAVTLDYSELTLRLREQQVRLTEGEFKVLEVLVANAESTVNRAVILEALYGAGDARETKIVDVYVSRLRQKLGSLGGEADIIQNFRGRGWRFTAPTEY